MQSQIKFQYILKNQTGFHHKVYTISQIEADGLARLFDADNYQLIARRRFTGITHKSGPDIYEGDVFREFPEDDEGVTVIYHVVMWITQRAAFFLVPAVHYPIVRDNDVSEEEEFDWLFDDAMLYDFSIDIGLPLVGNIYENPELLKA